MKTEKALELAIAWNNLKDDTERLHFLKDHNSEMMAVLDNDVTYVQFIDLFEEPEGFPILKSFDKCHYWSDGCIILFRFAGIKAQKC